MTVLTTPDSVRPPTEPEPSDGEHREQPQRSLPRREPVRPRGFRPDIEGLRAIAVVAVVLYHAALGLHGGYVGVDVFFVLSGFLITRQLVTAVDARGVRALPTFYAHRIRRLLPPAVVVVVATVLAARVWAPVLQVRGIAVDGLFTTFYGLNYRLADLGTDYQHMGVAASPLQHFWSLGVEEQYYLAWPIMVALIAWLGRKYSRILLTAVLVTVVIVSTYFSITVTAHSAPWAYFSLHTRAWELGVGALIAVFAARLAALPRRAAGLAAWIGLAGILYSAVAFTDATPFPGSAAWLPVGGTALVVAAGCGPRLGIERVLGEPLMQCLGRVSYSWYLWHWPMLVIIPLAVGRHLSVVERIGVVWLSLVVAVVTYFAVEGRTRRISMPNLRWLATGITVSGLVAACALVVMAHPPTSVGDGGAVHLVQSNQATDKVTQTMHRAIAAGVATVAVPRNLTPQPADAADSLPQATHDGCHAGFTAVTQGDCVYGDPRGKHTVVMFGDSHIEQWLPAFDRAGSTAHWKVVNWTKSACPSAQLTVFNPSLNRDYTECDVWRADTIDRIAALHPDLVIMGQSENVASSDISPDQFATATVTTLQALVASSGARVEYLADIPIPGTDLPGCVAEHLDDVRPCTFGLDGAYSYPDRHAALGPAVKAIGVKVIDPASWLCTPTTCPAVVGNLLVYRNDSHMTVPFSTWLTPMARSVLSKATPKRPAR